MTTTPLPNQRASVESEQPAQQPPPPISPPEAPHRHLRRSATNKVLGGVCGGLAEYTETDPLLWRVGFIAVAVMGAGILIYPLLWLLVPAGPDGTATSGIHDTLRNGRSPRS